MEICARFGKNRCKYHDIENKGIVWLLFWAKMAIFRAEKSYASSLFFVYQNSGGKFCEPFYVLVVEKTDDQGATMHVWRLVLSSDGEGLTGL